ELVIRGYRPEDADALRAILLSAFEAGELSGTTRSELEHWRSRLPADLQDTLLAVVDGHVAGLITPRRHQMIVGRACRRRGVGRRLVEAVEELNRERDAGPLYLALPHDNEGALAFYNALGLSYHHSTWHMRLRDDAIVPPPEFPPSVVRHPYRDEDVVAFVELVNTAFLDHPTPMSVSVERTRYVHSLPDFDPKNNYLLAPAASPDRLIALCRVDTEDDSGRTIGDVAIVGVLPEWRRRGLGRELLRWGVHRVRELGAAEVFLAVEGENEQALRLYEETGFERVEEWPRYSRTSP
ncbi:MAG: mycothiol synthase, partial [Thermomicrobiales bacterium]|nr:mycothiol synthase [Thermomicrobiales bacterium]